MSTRVRVQRNTKRAIPFKGEPAWLRGVGNNYEVLRMRNKGEIESSRNICGIKSPIFINVHNI